jgi:RPA family protein
VATISLTSATESASSTVQVTVAQVGAIIDATVAEFIAAAEDATQYRISGIISRDTGSDYGNIYIKDATGEIYIYGVLDAEGKTKQWNNMGINEGDIITVITPRSSYKDSPQGVNATVDGHIPVVEATVGAFLAAEDGDTYYRLVGTAVDLSGAGNYGNFNISDETGEVYIYGLLSGWGGAKGQFQTLVAETGLKTGDLLTIVGQRTSYKGTPQVGNGFYVDHEAVDAQ